MNRIFSDYPLNPGTPPRHGNGRAGEFRLQTSIHTANKIRSAHGKTILPTMGIISVFRYSDHRQNRVTLLPVFFSTYTITRIKCNSPSHVLARLQLHGPQPSRLLCPWGFSRQEYWSGLPFPSSGDLSPPRDQTWVSCIAGRFYTGWASWKSLLLLLLEALDSSFIHSFINSFTVQWASAIYNIPHGPVCLPCGILQASDHSSLIPSFIHGALNIYYIPHTTWAYFSSMQNIYRH